MDRTALKCLGEDALNVLCDMPDEAWVECLKAPFGQGAGRGHSPLTAALKVAGAQGNGINQLLNTAASPAVSSVICRRWENLQRPRTTMAMPLSTWLHL